MNTSKDERMAGQDPKQESLGKTETQIIEVSLPDMHTASLLNNAIGDVIEPIKRERATKAEMQAKLAKQKVSGFFVNYSSFLFNSDIQFIMFFTGYTRKSLK